MVEKKHQRSKVWRALEVHQDQVNNTMHTSPHPNHQPKTSGERSPSVVHLCSSCSWPQTHTSIGTGSPSRRPPGSPSPAGGAPVHRGRAPEPLTEVEGWWSQRRWRSSCPGWSCPQTWRRPWRRRSPPSGPARRPGTGGPGGGREASRALGNKWFYGPLISM